MNRTHRWIIVAGVLALLAGAGSAESGMLALTLTAGQAPMAATDRESRDVDLELSLVDGVWQPDITGYVVWLNRAGHVGQVMRVETRGAVTALDVTLTVNADRWTPGGAADYRLEFTRGGDGATGTYTGHFLGQEVRGTLTGRMGPLWTTPRPGFIPLAPGEHPRLIFRAADLPLLRQHARTPEGQAIMARVTALLDRDIATNQKSGTMLAAGHGFAYQMTGERKHAERAWALLEPKLIAFPYNASLMDGIHIGPYAIGVALTYDWCYPAWSAEQRGRAADWLLQAATYTDINGGVFSGQDRCNPNPWSNGSAIRSAGAAVSALAVVGDMKADGTPVGDLMPIVMRAVRDQRRYLRYGLGESGFCMEGEFYKRMTWNTGPGHTIQAMRTALGINPIAGMPAAYTILGEWMQRPMAAYRTDTWMGVGNDENSGMWPVGLVTVPTAYRPAARWLYDRTFGLPGDGTFGLAWAWQGAYLMANYPFDTPAQEPGAVMPWVAPDTTKGHWIFRRTWRDADDTVMVLHLNSETLLGCHNERIGTTGDLRLWALGTNWLSGGSLIEAGVSNALLGPKVTYARTTDDGVAVLSMRCNDYYLRDARGNAPAGAKLVTFPRLGKFADAGIAAQRCLALDTTGVCGAPVLLVILDRVQGAAKPVWQLPLVKEAGRVGIDGGRFIVGDPAAANLQGTLVAPAGAKLAGALTATGGDTYFAILTVQRGQAPQVTVAGEGAAANVTVGGRTVAYDGEKLVLGP